MEPKSVTNHVNGRRKRQLSEVITHELLDRLEIKFLGGKLRNATAAQEKTNNLKIDSDEEEDQSVEKILEAMNKYNYDDHDPDVEVLGAENILGNLIENSWNHSETTSPNTNNADNNDDQISVASGLQQNNSIDLGTFLSNLARDAMYSENTTPMEAENGQKFSFVEETSKSPPKQETQSPQQPNQPPANPKKHYQCGICHKHFKTKDTMTRHHRTHLSKETMPYKCTMCNASFARSDNLKTHMKTHTGEKNIHCCVCEYRSARSDTMKRHYRTRHPETFVKIYGEHGMNRVRKGKFGSHGGRVKDVSRYGLLKKLPKKKEDEKNSLNSKASKNEMDEFRDSIQKIILESNNNHNNPTSTTPTSAPKIVTLQEIQQSHNLPPKKRIKSENNCNQSIKTEMIHNQQNYEKTECSPVPEIKSSHTLASLSMSF